MTAVFAKYVAGVVLRNNWTADKVAGNAMTENSTWSSNVKVMLFLCTSEENAAFRGKIDCWHDLRTFGRAQDKYNCLSNELLPKVHKNTSLGSINVM